MIPAIIITVLVVFCAIRLLVVYADKIKFYSTGSDNGFKFGEITVLWKLAKMAGIDDPMALYLSVPQLNKAISQVLSDARRRGIENSDRIQNFLTKLYKFRTKINLEHENKKGLESTKFLDKGQKLRIILHGRGVFTSEILNNGYEIVVRLPLQNKVITAQSEEWVGQNISVYLWRKGDAAYVFDTRVTNAGVFNGQTVIYLAQTNELLRTQKRKSVRCACNLNAAMYFIKQEVIDFNLVETEPGFKVVIEDISEDGAMIRVGGQGVVNAQIKLQFKLGDVLILMYGLVRAVEYNKEINQSRLHFECVHLEEEMKNAILSFVYNVLPPEEKDIFDALTGTEQDKAEDSTAPKEDEDFPETKAPGQQSEQTVKTEEVPQVAEAVPVDDDITTDDLDSLASLDVN